MCLPYFSMSYVTFFDPKLSLKCDSRDYFRLERDPGGIPPPPLHSHLSLLMLKSPGPWRLPQFVAGSEFLKDLLLFFLPPVPPPFCFRFRYLFYDCSLVSFLTCFFYSLSFSFIVFTFYPLTSPTRIFTAASLSFLLTSFLLLLPPYILFLSSLLPPRFSPASFLLSSHIFLFLFHFLHFIVPSSPFLHLLIPLFYLYLYPPLFSILPSSSLPSFLLLLSFSPISFPLPSLMPLSFYALLHSIVFHVLRGT